MTFNKVERFRAPDPLERQHFTGDNFGWFVIRRTGAPTLNICAIEADPENGNDWDHVSVSSKTIPTWTDMDMVKKLFWSDDDTVVQFHVPSNDHINVAKTCLHLWCYRGGELPRPPKDYV